MEYKELKILVLVSIIIGFALSMFLIPFLGSDIGYYDYGFNYVPQSLLIVMMYYSMGLTIIVFIIYPILCLRKKNKIRLGITN